MGVCAKCGGSFEGGCKKYCSQECLEAATLVKGVIRTVCPNCGKLFLGCANQWCCSAKCLAEIKSDYLRGKTKMKYRQMREKVFGVYGIVCAVCGESDIDVLSIDHIADDGAKHRKEIGGNLYRWLTKNNFPDGFQTLCRNCNWKKMIVRRREGNASKKPT